jgi:cephalosporin-C deacetylase
MMSPSGQFLTSLLVALSATATPAHGGGGSGGGDRAADIEAFWRGTRERLSREPMDPTVEPVAEAVPFRTMKVTLRSLDGVHFRARLALPVKGEAPASPWPVIVTTPGYGGEQQGVMLADCQRGYAVLQVFPRGQGESASLWKLERDKLGASLDGPQGAYYEGAYADVMRAIDFVTSRDDLDHTRIALVGTSQGGGIALAVAAIDPRVKAVVAHVPFLCDIRLAARTPGSLVRRLLDRAGRNDDAALRTLDYFDPFQFAPRLRPPALISAGGKDNECPSATIRAVYDRLPARDDNATVLKVYPNLAHTSCVDFYNLSWTWLDRHLRGAPPTTAPTSTGAPSQSRATRN